jgi:MarR family transcriptional regulator, lower aerobic nicotinate degradation pathway regulator
MGTHTISSVSDNSPRSDNSARQVMESIRRIVQVLRVGARAAERDAGVSGAQLFVLERLSAAGRALSVNELAERTLTHQSSVSAVVQKLENRGLLQRSAAAEDARRAQLSLTAKAHALLRKAPRVAQDRVLDALADMSDADRKSLSRLLGELARRMSGTDGEAPASMLFEDDASISPQGRRRKPPRERTPRSRKRLHG